MHRRFVAGALAFLLHNGEEALADLPGWSEAHPQLGWMAAVMPRERFLIAAAGLTLLVLALALAASLRPGRWSEPVLQVLAWIMIVNATSHVALSLLTGSIMPGVISAVLILLPVMGWIVATRPRQAP